ncbi:MAG: YifB family Mg chelatase-like AAA ATPase [Candidatus Eremiobacteraeota bacterium]|nr:YifB family Mg chelatase-like AAA ATPase [Candidatus Eremiobacteraeota bacterium]
MLSLAFSAAMQGIEGYVVRVEADSSPGSPHLAIIGLPDRALNEARERVRSAIFNSGFAYPAGRLLINLSPADIRKEGPAFDLPIALALLAIDEQIDRLQLQEFAALGELALDGKLQPVQGILPMVLGARNAGFAKLIVPNANADEAALVDGIQLFAVDSLQAAVATVIGNGAQWKIETKTVAPQRKSVGADFADVRGQHGAKRALEIAAAGGHNLLFVGPPGCGKTMLARRLPSILPPMTNDEALEVTKIYSVAGLLGANPGIVRARPFRFPHHTISQTALVGGGSIAKPGEISLAHHGVLFLDELPEFNRASIEVMRQPLEEGTVTIARAAGTFTYPARFMLVASMNPCPCGYRGTRSAECRCDENIVAKYIAKLSGPLLDRIDLQIEIRRVPFDEMVKQQPAESSAMIRERVQRARSIQQARLKGSGYFCNADIPAHAVRAFCRLDDSAMRLLAAACAQRHFSARALDRIARVARTIADLADSEEITTQHVAEAIQYRSLERLDARAA